MSGGVFDHGAHEEDAIRRRVGMARDAQTVWPVFWVCTAGLALPGLLLLAVLPDPAWDSRVVHSTEP